MTIYRDLLESEDCMIFDMYQLLLTKPVATLEDFQRRYGLTEKNLRGAVHDWRKSGNHLAFGLDFFIHQEVTMFMTDQFSERALFAHLLKKSSYFKILYTVLKDPIIPMKEFENQMFLGRRTIRRRLEMLVDLLATYGLTIVKKRAHLIEGSELQIRFLRFHLELLSRPELVTAAPQQKFKVIKEIAETRAKLGFGMSQDDIPEDKLFNLENYFGYMLDEQGFLFLWRQLLGLEPMWMGQLYQAFVEKAVGKDRYLAFFGDELSQQIYRIHAYGLIFEGDLLLQLTPHQILSEDARRIHRAAQRYLPDYPQLIQRHPEIPCAYQKLLDKRLYIDRFREVLVEDPYLVKVRSTG